MHNIESESLLNSNPTFMEGVSEFAENFDAFIIDLWGVLHDGTLPYPDAIECLNTLKKNGKKIILLSNAPRQSHKAEKVLDEMGFSKDSYDFLLTSGQVTHDYMSVTSNFGNNNYFYIGPEKDEDIIEDLEKYSRVTEPEDADFVIVTGFDNFGDKLEAKLPEAKLCLEAGLPMVCANPDRIVVKQDGRTMLCAGMIAEWYAHNGGRVQYFGKPYNDAYQECFELLEILDPSTVAAIGDSLHTDIDGAKDHGIFSVLVTGGILADELGAKYGEFPDLKQLLNICTKEGVTPDVIIPAFKW